MSNTASTTSPGSGSAIGSCLSTRPSALVSWIDCVFSKMRSVSVLEDAALPEAATSAAVAARPATSFSAWLRMGLLLDDGRTVVRQVAVAEHDERLVPGIAVAAADLATVDD